VVGHRQEGIVVGRQVRSRGFTVGRGEEADEPVAIRDRDLVAIGTDRQRTRRGGELDGGRRLSAAKFVRWSVSRGRSTVPVTWMDRIGTVIESRPW
jgi:hypothetical protein